jgi:hypothetical protein
MGSDSGAIGVEVDALHGTGNTISARSTGAGSAAKGLMEGLDSAGGGIGHYAVKSAMTAFVTNDVMDPANKLPVQLTDGGHNVSNVAATARDSDNAGAAALTAPISGTSEVGTRINRQI